ncbi:MAG: hypothetical protein ACLQGP_38720 [Isosphaeraceae bacterium]
MGKKRDIRQIEGIAREFQMDPQDGRDFGKYVEDCKSRGDKGTGKDGDFTYEELRRKAREFRGED